MGLVFIYQIFLMFPNLFAGDKNFVKELQSTKRVPIVSSVTIYCTFK